VPELVDSDAELVAAVLAGDRSAFAGLVERHEHGVRATAFAVLRDHHAAQDAAQEAFILAYRKLGTLRDRGAFGSWVRTVTRNLACDAARRRPNVVPLDRAGPIPVEETDGKLEEAARRLIEAAGRLPEHERAVVMLYYFDGHRVARIAEILGSPVGTVTMRLSRARTRLRRWLQEPES